MRSLEQIRFAVALIVLFLPGLAFAIAPWNDLLDTWHASQQAVDAGYPRKIELRSLGKAEVDGKACQWEESEGEYSVLGEKKTYTQLHVQCPGYKPFLVKMGGMLYETGNTVLVYFGRKEEIDCNWQFDTVVAEIRKRTGMPCFNLLYETYFNADGIKEAHAKTRAEQEKRSLKAWGNK